MSDLTQLVADELAQPVDRRVSAMAAAIAAKYPDAARAVLFYGSCLRESRLDGLMLDFYLIVSDYEAAYGKRWLATANRLIPPNVFPVEHNGLAAKVAVLSEADFHRLCSLRAGDVSVWARFAQPSRLVWVLDDAVRASAIAAIVEASVTLFQRTLPALAKFRAWGIGDMWRRGFDLTYRSELRAERTGRAASVVETDPLRYERFGEAALAAIARRIEVGPNGEVGLYESAAENARFWRRMRRRGKMLTLLRLAKATTTYAGGVDYIAWKINRHAGTDIRVTPWQRRHPILGALTLLPRLIRSGAIK